MHFKAGYIVDSIGQIINDFRSSLNKRIPAEQNKLNQINGLLQYVSSFDVEFPYKNQNPDYKKLNPVLATLNNIITRGLPTSAPLLLEQLFSKINLIEPNKEEFEFHFPKSIKQISYETVFELLHIIEPNLEIKRTNYGGNLGSNLEWDFIKNNPFLKQILESQRNFSTINDKLTGNRTVDFCFTSPYLHWNNNKHCYEKVGRIFEVDGPHHSLSEYRYYDAYRDAIAEEENFETIRFSTERIREDNTDFEELIEEFELQNSVVMELFNKGKTSLVDFEKEIVTTDDKSSEFEKVYEEWALVKISLVEQRKKFENLVKGADALFLEQQAKANTISDVKERQKIINLLTS